MPTARQGDPVEVSLPGGGQQPLHRPGGVRANLCLKGVKAGQVQLHRPQARVLPQCHHQHALFPRLVPAPSHGTAGPGAQGLPRPEAVRPVNMAQGQIG